MGALVLRRRVVPPLARRARESDDLAHRLLRDLRDDAGTHRPPPLPDRKPQLLLHRHRRDQVDRHRHVVPRHHPLPPPRPPHQPRPPPHPPPLHPPRHHRPPPRDRKDVLDRHQKWLVDRPLRRRDVAVHRLHQLPYALRRLTVLRLLHRPQRRPPDHRNLVPRKLVLLQQLPHLQLHQVQNLRVVHHVHLVHEHHQKRHVHLPRQQHVLPRLRHRPVVRRHHHNRPVHLRRPRDHVLDVVGVPRTVDVRVVPLRRLVLHVRHRNRDPPLPLLRRVVDRRKLPHRQPATLRFQHLRDRRRLRLLPVIDVPDRPNVHVRLRPLVLRLRHPSLPPVGGHACDSRSGAHVRDRTGDLVLTKDALCRLSYMGERKAHEPQNSWSGKRDSNPRPPAWKAGALPLSYSRPSESRVRQSRRWWGGEDLNPRRRTPADLQSAPFGHLGTSPNPPARAPNPLKSWRWREDLNPRPTAYKAVALPLSYASTDKTSL